jgi:NAD(P)-dependent dehydrogenase (short-subunit alcohol dehydrogenase family)
MKDPLAHFRLDGRTALVTGAGRGMGRSIALALAAAGAQTWLVSRTRSELEEVAAEIDYAGGTARVAVCDVTDDAAVSRTFAAIPALDVLVNNAGMNIPEPFVDVTAARLDQVMALNVRSMFVVAQAATR